MKYRLMNQDIPVIDFFIKEDEYGELHFQEIERLQGKEPIGYHTMRRFLESRRAPKHRQHIEKLLLSCGCYELDGYLNVTHGLSLNDTFWVKREDQSFTWEQVSLYRHPFDETIARIAFEGGLYGEQFSTTSPEFTTEGSYAKCWLRENDKIYLVKRGTDGFSNAGMEPYSEYYGSQVAQILCPGAIAYELTHYRGAVVSKCELFTNEEIGFVPFYRTVADVHEVTIQSMRETYEKYDSLEEFRRMIVLDSLIFNVDRHLGNHGFLVDNISQEIQKMAPVFDLNMALLPFAVQEDFLHWGEFIKEKVPRIGRDFVSPAQRMLTSEIRKDLINLKDFRFEQHPTCPCPEWRLEAMNWMLGNQIRKILDNPRQYVEIRDFSNERKDTLVLKKKLNPIWDVGRKKRTISREDDEIEYER